jgi:hypothetical protein
MRNIFRFWLSSYKEFIKFLFLTMTLFFIINLTIFNTAISKPKLDITATQSLHFGTFCLTGTAGGTITVGYDGSRTCTGSIVLLSKLPHAQPAIVEIINCHDWHLVILYDANTNLEGSSGGRIKLDIGPTEKGRSGTRFNTNGDCDIPTPIRVGGTLFIPGNTKSGVYDGDFEITIKKD